MHVAATNRDRLFLVSHAPYYARASAGAAARVAGRSWCTLTHHLSEEGPALGDFKPLTFDALQVGETFVSDEHLVTPDDVETYAFAVDDHHPWFFGASPFGGPVVHPTLLGNQALGMRHSKYIVHSGLHAKMELRSSITPFSNFAAVIPSPIC